MIRKANQNDKEVIKQLWLQYFIEDSKEYIDFYFNNIYDQSNTYVLEENKQLISCLQTNPIQIVLNGKVVNASYIVGVCTRKEYQRQGYMRRLMNYVLNVLKETEMLTLIQAYDFNVYKPFDFKIMYYKQRYILNNIQNNDIKLTNITNNDISLLIDIYYQANYNNQGYAIRNKAYYQRLFKEMKVLDVKGYKYKDQGYILYIEEDKQIKVVEIQAINQTVFDILVNSLNSESIIIDIALNQSISNQKINEVIPFMMIRVNDYEKLTKYINADINKLLEKDNYINEYV